MSIDELRKSGKQVAFGEGNARHGYHRADNWEVAERKLRHKFWDGAKLSPVEGRPGVYLATLKGTDDKRDGVTRVVFVL